MLEEAQKARADAAESVADKELELADVKRKIERAGMQVCLCNCLSLCLFFHLCSSVRVCVYRFLILCPCLFTKRSFFLMCPCLFASVRDSLPLCPCTCARKDGHSDAPVEACVCKLSFSMCTCVQALMRIVASSVLARKDGRSDAPLQVCGPVCKFLHSKWHPAHVPACLQSGNGCA